MNSSCGRHFNYQTIKQASLHCYSCLNSKVNSLSVTVVGQLFALYFTQDIFKASMTLLCDLCDILVWSSHQLFGIRDPYKLFFFFFHQNLAEKTHNDFCHLLTRLHRERETRSLADKKFLPFFQLVRFLHSPLFSFEKSWKTVVNLLTVS